jgi:NADH-quinone oxidoreductase subunit L
VLLLIPLLPFLGFVVNAAVGRRLSKPVSGGVACAVMVGAFLVAATATWPLLFGQGVPIEQEVYRWIAVGNLDIKFTLRLDQLATVMVLVVTFVGALIHVYSIGYMHEETDSEYARYFSYLNLFAAFMLLLVLAANFVVMFVGWEGVGLCSYLLIGFWFQKPSAAEAGKKAFVVNRIGDFGFLLGVLLIFATFGTLDIQQVAGLVAPMPREVAGGTLTLITLLLFLGATGKSAQIPLYIWLPDAMEGPTPVSALIHAATMVTAGVYMIARNAVLFGHAPETLAVVAVIGAATALVAGTIGLVQNDIKRVLAYSTVSQLGYMFLAMGAGAWAAGIFHLMTHAFFKALLFLGSGAVIHALAGEQDMRRMGGLKRDLPVTYWTFLAATLAISGVPLFSGFFSKDEILFRTYTAGFPILWGIGVATALLTAVYMFRVVFLTFHGERAAAAASDRGDHAHGDHAAHRHLHDAPPSMAIPLIVLAIGSVLAGYAGVPRVLGGENRIERFLEPSFEARGPVTALQEARAPEPLEAPAGAPAGGEAVPASTELGLMGISTVLALSGIGIAAFFFLRRREAADAAARRFAGLYRLLLNKYYVDEVYDATIVQPIKRLSTGVLWKVVDAGLIDGAVNGAGITVRSGAGLLRRLQTGSVRVSAAALFLGVVVIVGYYLWL